jgi:hypothetical protein
MRFMVAIPGRQSNRSSESGGDRKDGSIGLFAWA